MSHRYRNRGYRKRYKQNLTLFSVGCEAAVSLPADSPVLAIFKTAAFKLKERQDRHERLVKLSRDITIESKRIIFLLHSAIHKEDHEKVITEASTRLEKLKKDKINAIGMELKDKPAYLHSRAVTNGFQEFIEAYTLFSLTKNLTLPTYEETIIGFSYKVNDGESEQVVTTLLPRIDFMLGIADLTGELMRKTINSISGGDSESCFHLCQVVRDLYTGFLGLHGSGRELAQKLKTTRSNVAKVESAVYALRVRGGEAPPKLLLPAPALPPPDWEGQAQKHSDDEGFY